jgi:hypothetical protein
MDKFRSPVILSVTYHRHNRLESFWLPDAAVTCGNLEIAFFMVEQQMFLGRVVERSRRVRADCLDNVGTSTSQNPIDLHGLFRG